MKYTTILETIGKTSHVKINRLFGDNHNIWLKLERENPGGSMKDRIAYNMILDAEAKGIITPGVSTIIEATSGNTGIGLAMVCAVKGYRLILTMPESMSVERRQLMKAYGAEFVLTPKELRTQGAIDKALELQKSIPNAWIPMQMRNPANPEAHVKNTVQEILADFPEGFDYFIAGVGTSGHIMGVSRVLKQKFPHIKVIAVEPEKSPVLSGGTPASHAIQGIGPGFVQPMFDRSFIDEIVQVKDERAFYFAQQMPKQEGILVGISTGANMAATEIVLKRSSKPLRVLTFNYDTGERYLSVPDLF